MDDELYKCLIGILLIILGVLILVFQIRNPLKKDENEFGKAAYYQFIILGIVLIIAGLIF